MKRKIAMVFLAFIANFAMANNERPLNAFAFMVAKHDCAATYQEPGQAISQYHAHWDGKYRANNSLIEETLSFFDVPENAKLYGLVYRSYSQKHGWTSKFFHTESGNWVDVGTRKLGGVQVQGQHLLFKTEDALNNVWDVKITKKAQGGFIWQGVTLAESASPAGIQSTFNCSLSDRK